MGNVLKLPTEDPQHVFAYDRLLSPPLDPENENLRVFSIEELKKTTKDFRQDMVVNGEDGSVRTFYKGSINGTTSAPSRTKTAVSVMEYRPRDSSQALHAWKEEVKSLGKHPHPNLVKFLGYCCEDNRSFLVFEYLHKGTLDHHIYGKKEVLSWATRVKIAIGIAQGVAFLHSINNSSLHLELRMHNIMLDEENIAKLFYLATNKECLENPSNLDAGRIYIPSRCWMTGHFRMDSDVYAFGVILLELFTGSKGGAKRSRNDTRTRLRLFNELIDPRLEGNYPVTAAMRMGTLIQKCTEDEHTPVTRPPMQQVLDVLNYIAEIH